MSIYITALLWILFCITGTVNAAEKQPVPERAYAADDLDSVRNIAKFMAKQAVDLNLGNPLSPMTFTNFGTGSLYYALYEKPMLRLFDVAGKKYLGGWDLTIRTDVALERKLGEQLNKQKMEPAYEYYAGLSGSGCLWKSPLRYTDLDKDGLSELFVLFGGRGPSSLAIFSTRVNKVIFSSLLEYDNAYAPVKDQDGVNGWTNSTGLPQYIYDLGDIYGSYERGYRSFGKLFFGDTNDDGIQDIILWRKYFESLNVGDAKKGFAKKDELFVHYSLVDGDYKKQPTAAKTIKGWLAAKQLSWQQGFPSRSECPGQEGQLIPELHDPLLNDPDVLH